MVCQQSNSDSEKEDSLKYGQEESEDAEYNERPPDGHADDDSQFMVG